MVSYGAPLTDSVEYHLDDTIRKMESISSSTKQKKLQVSLLVALLAVFVPMASAQDQSGSDRRGTYEWALTAYYGVLTDDTLSDVFTFDADYDSNYRFLTFALSKRLKRIGAGIDIEAEGQIAKHTQGQDHVEFNGLIVVRLLPFPWDRHVDTSVAVGAGLSYATDLPSYEFERKDGDTRRLLGYLMFELTFGMNSIPRWDVVTRIHHRSGAWGVFGDGVRGASNAITLGIKHHF